MSNIHQDTKEMRLAYELADALNDRDALPVYIAFVQRFREDALRKILNKVMSIPDHKIKRTRGALFTYLIKQQGNGGFRN
jgi:hypothetical protein